MNCVKKNCSITSDSERMLACWLCHNLCHFKCSGLSTLINEAVNNAEGCGWFCWSCRKPAVEFFRFFQDKKTRFLDIEKNASLLLGSVLEYGKLFTDFTSLDNLKSPPQASPPRRKSARKGNKDKDKDVLSVTPGMSGYNTKTQNISVPITIPPSISVQLQPTTVLNENENESAETIEIIETQQDDLNTAINHSDATNLAINQRVLNIVPPRRSIFISRFTADTTADDIECYIKNKLNLNANISVRKFLYSNPRDIVSFKLTVPMDYFDQIVNPDFWPINALVREYIYKENNRMNNIAQLPSRNDLNSKN